jgi:hypothetical protein
MVGIDVGVIGVTITAVSSTCLVQETNAENRIKK